MLDSYWVDNKWETHGAGGERVEDQRRPRNLEPLSS